MTDVSQRLLAHHGGLRGLFRLDVAELARVRGLGDAKAVRVKAALELGRRLAALSPEERPPVGSPEDVANLLSIEMAALEQEQLRVVLLDTKHRILGTRTVYQGSVNQAQVRVPETIGDGATVRRPLLVGCLRTRILTGNVQRDHLGCLVRRLEAQDHKRQGLHGL